MLLQNTADRQVPLFAATRKNGDYLYNKGTMFSMPIEGNIVIPLNIDTEFWTVWKLWISGKISDTRFANYLRKQNDLSSGRLGISTQIKGIATDAPEFIYVHQEVAELIPRHQPIRFDFHPVDYLASLGYEVEIQRYDWGKTPKGLPTACFDLKAHFALAEAMMIVRGGCREDFETLMRATGNKPRFEMSRRLRSVTPGKRGESDFVKMPWVLTIDGIDYQVSIVWTDTGAIHGIASYKDVCSNVDIELEHKDDLDQDDKERMLATFIDKPDESDAYSLGDLMPYPILEKNAEQFGKIYEALGLTPKLPKLTIGSTVKDLFLSTLQKHIEVDDDEFKMVEKELLEPVSAMTLRKRGDRTSALLAKVVGGRCRNNRPTHTQQVDRVLCDLDISGCYGEGQRNQLYMIGKPEIIDYDADSTCNDYLTLGELIDGSRAKGFSALRNDLGSEGTYFGIVSTSEPLKLAQDFLPSWFQDGNAAVDLLAKSVAKMSCDSEATAVDNNFDETKGAQKILNYEVHNAVFTHDFIQWLDNVCSPQQRKELYDKLQVKAFIYYAESKRCHSFEELREARKNWTGKNKVKRKGKGKNATLSFDDGECHAWYGVNMGELFINDLIANRKLYDKGTSLNKLFKDCVNTSYGDMTSKFFSSANVVVGNNITGRARALAWYMEKGLFGFQTITDGCAFDLNKVVYPKEGRRVTAVELVNFYRRFGSSNIRTAPIGGSLKTGAIGQVERIELDWQAYNSYEEDKGVIKPKTRYAPVIKQIRTEGVETLEPTFKPDKKYPEYLTIDKNHGMKWIDKAAMSHLRDLFQGVDVLHKSSTRLEPHKKEDGTAGYTTPDRIGQFEFEAKDFYNSGSFHGTANYCLTNPNGSIVKFRAYETKKNHDSVELKGSELVITDRYGKKNNPAKDFIKLLTGDLSSISRQVVFVKQAILKVSDYKNRVEHWSQLGLYPGDTFHKAGLLREFSLSQFTFKDLAQYQGWNKAIFRRKNNYGQSIESFFLNADGTLDYQTMVETVDRMIDEGVVDPFKALDPNENAFSRLTLEHPSWETLKAVKAKLGTPEAELELDWTEEI